MVSIYRRDTTLVCQQPLAIFQVIYWHNCFLMYTVFKQVCVQHPTSAVNVALPALLLHAMLWSHSVDISYLLGPQQQTRRTLLRQANATDRQTDTIDPALHTV